MIEVHALGPRSPEAVAVQVTLTIPEELASRLQPFEEQLPRILELGLRQWNGSRQPEFEGINDILETLARLPGPEEILALRPSANLQTRIHSLLEKNRTTGLLPDEAREWEQYEYLEHIVGLAKANAALKLKTG